MAVSQRARNADRKGMSKRFGLYLRDVRAEMRKVAWPNRKEILSYTGVVLFFLLVVGLFLGLVDVVLAQAFQALGIL